MHMHMHWWSGALIIVQLLHTLMITKAEGPLPGGELQKCTNEGEAVDVPIATGNSCIKCFCKEGIVRCNQKQQCSSTEGCHNIMYPRPEGSCCKEVCLGCYLNGVSYESGTVWNDKLDPCVVHTCIGGIITTSKKICHSTCTQPVFVRGQCCPICRGCFYKGKTYADRHQFQDKTDPCLTCECRNGFITCNKVACPVLNCPVDSLVNRSGQCCLVCEGKRELITFSKKDRCFFHPKNKVYSEGQIVTQDYCKNCTCLSGSIICDMKTCPILRCRKRDQLPAAEGKCCSKCRLSKSKCKINGRRIKHGRVWYRDPCTRCVCYNGTTHCRQQNCASIIDNCPKQTHELQYNEGQCCPKCMEVSASCVVFGDPHYRTFDGLLYTFQGTCQYTLAQQCSSKKRPFSVRVRNRAWPNKKHYAYTDTVTIVVKSLKVSLHQQLRVTVGDEEQTLPFIKLGLMTIVQQGYTLVLSTTLGLTVIWDGISYLEVTVPQSYKGRMCGLCGNYNGNPTDDFTGKRKTKFTNGLEFGNSWKTGTQCSQMHLSNKQKCMADDKTRRWIKDRCDIVKREAYDDCRKLIDVDSYHKECIEKLCQCENKAACFCDLLLEFEYSCNTPGVLADDTMYCRQ